MKPQLKRSLTFVDFLEIQSSVIHKVPWDVLVFLDENNLDFKDNNGFKSAQELELEEPVNFISFFFLNLQNGHYVRSKTPFFFVYWHCFQKVGL